MNFCTHCGNQLKPDARFCSKCGQLVTEKPTQKKFETSPEPICRQCGNRLTPNVNFCISCGTPVSAELLQSLPVQQGLSMQPYPDKTNAEALPGIQKKINKPKHRILRTLFAVILLASGGLAAFYFIKSPVNKVSNEPGSDTVKTTAEMANLQTEKVEDLAASVEKIFAASDTAALATVMSTTLLEQRRAYLEQLIPFMPAFAEDFKTRRLLYSNERYAVYEFSSSGGKFTVDFCLGEDGTWKIMRF